MANKTRKHRKVNLDKKHLYAKKGTQLKCLMKSCKVHKYKSVYGSTGGTIRSNVVLFTS